METDYLTQLEDALINAAIEKQIAFDKLASESETEYVEILEFYLKHSRHRQYWIAKGMSLFNEYVSKPFQ